ncbi:aminodeoxychorismate synthase component I [bacterium]|nr:aminodeoxychorismate synthase component I [bacterium]
MKIVDILNFVENNEYSAFFYTPAIYPEAESVFLKNPDYILTARSWEEIDSVLDQADTYSKREDLTGVALLPYEAGYNFQPVDLEKFRKHIDSVPSVKFMFYNRKNTVRVSSRSLDYKDAPEISDRIYRIDNYRLDVSKDEYVRNIRKIKDYIENGETYQINYTVRALFDLNGDLSSLFLNTVFHQSARYTSFINLKDEYILSFSPELFFETDYSNIKCKPMKGTLKRGSNHHEDMLIEKGMSKDEKNFAENVMIVDLLRNDLGRISKTDKVKVEKLFEMEKYETLYQLTSTVKGELKERKLSTIIKNLFPCGSITGAPKIRSMEIISELEKSLRSIYTGSIGLILKGKAVFNIAIRTLRIDKQNMSGEMGLGGGIVWDSIAEEEYKEALLKGKFLMPAEKFEILESILFENGECFLLDLHLERMKKSADYFLFYYDEKKVRDILESAITEFRKDNIYKVRVLLDKWGDVTTDYQEIRDDISNVDIVVSFSQRTEKKQFLFHKTTFRPWDTELKSAREKGFFEVIFCDKNSRVLEGAFTNIFLEKNGKIFTPALDSVILNGCYRQHLIKTCGVIEKDIFIDDLKNADRVFLGNSVRKKIYVNKIKNLKDEQEKE